MAAPNSPVDEVQYSRPDIIQWWLEADKGPSAPPPYVHMEERFIHRYFSESPFFDWTSKNGLLIAQSNTSPDAFYMAHNRQALEDALRKSAGLEYMIVSVPTPVTGKDVPAGQQSNVYVIRKQERLAQRTEEEARRGVYPRTETTGTYFAVNERIYQAPSVADVVESRMLNATVSLEKMFEKAADLPGFAPATGHTYLPSSRKAATAISAQGSPTRSREGSVAPSAGADMQSLRSDSVAPEDQTTNATQNEGFLYAQLLGESFSMAANYGDEYMDENPLIGQPGNFRFTSSAAAAKKQKADEEAALVAAHKAKEARQNTSRPGSPKSPVKAPTPPPVFTEARATAKVEKDRKEEKKRRRKSRPNTGSGTTPTTPKGAALSAAAAGG